MTTACLIVAGIAFAVVLLLWLTEFSPVSNYEAPSGYAWVRAFAFVGALLAGCLASVAFGYHTGVAAEKARVDHSFVGPLP